MSRKRKIIKNIEYIIFYVLSNIALLGLFLIFYLGLFLIGLSLVVGIFIILYHFRTYASIALIFIVLAALTFAKWLDTDHASNPDTLEKEKFDE